MRAFRKWVLVSSFAVAAAAGATTKQGPFIGDISEQAAAPYVEIITRILDFIVLYNRLSWPPG
jgi:hypothetical protein